MTRGSRLVCMAAATLLLTLAVRAADQAPGATPQASSPKPPAFAQGFGGQASAPFDYLGSASCARCHGTEHTQWMDSIHVKMTKPVAEATIVGDFRDGTTFADHDRAYTFGRKDGQPFVTVKFGQAAPETFMVDYTLGAKRYQGYLSMLPEGRIYVLPIFWHIASKRWIDWKEITPIPDGAHDIRQVWNVNCFNCHGTNIAQGYDLNAKRYNSTWTEMGIGCEACHGPGRDHIALMDKWEKDPASKPAYDTSSNNRQLSDILKIFSTRSSDPKRVYDTCAYCHGNKNNVFVGFKGGDRYTDYALPFLVLVAFGVLRLPGVAGEALRKAQDEYILSLDTFPDVATKHAAKGWFELERGNSAAALVALDRATVVEPAYAYPWVVKGVMLARQGRFSDAVELWKKARRIEPSYPNINELIGEAERRK